MTLELDYKKLGLRCGIEIHQQLEGLKLFCHTPTRIRDDTPDYIITRKLRAVIGETGVIDEAAAAESLKNKTYSYEGYTDTIGLVELDEEPPHPVNEDAVKTAMQVSLMLGMSLVDEAQIMRKTVVDGSNTSGFQRTSLIAIDGQLTTDAGKKITIPSLMLEEDSAKKVRNTQDTVYYNLSRLGIPLLEITTEPDMNDPVETQEVAKKIGSLLRSTGKAKRGLGTIRQDVNVSIIGGNRVEIKGAQDLKNIPTLIDYEIIRQSNILLLKKEFPLSKKEVSSLSAQDVTECFIGTQCELISKALKQNNVVLGVALKGCAGALGKELQPKKRVGTDLAQYAKVHVGTGGIIHSDEDFSKYQFTKEPEKVRQFFGLKKSDAFFLVVAPHDVAKRAVACVKERLTMLLSGVPKEVRNANQDSTSTYLRPMPGQARMYPETDIPPMTLDAKGIILPELIEDKIDRLIKSYELSTDLAKAIAKGIQADTFEKLVSTYKTIKPSLIAELLETTPKLLRRKHNLEIQLGDDIIIPLFDALAQERIVQTSIVDIIVKAQTESLSDAIKSFSLLNKEEISKIITEVLTQNPQAPFGALMGKVMAQTNGRADGKVVTQLIKERS